MDTACMEIHRALVNVIYVTLKTLVYSAGGQWAEEVTTKQDPLHRRSKGNASVRQLPNVGLEIGSFCIGTMVAHSVSGISGFQPALIRIARN